METNKKQKNIFHSKSKKTTSVFFSGQLLKTQLTFSIVVVAVFISVSSCKKFIDISPPTNLLVTSTVFSSNSTATSALLSIYRQMNTESYSMASSTGFLSDELRNWSSQQNIVQFYTNALMAQSNLGPWKNGYSYIYQSNAILEGIKNNNALDVSVINQLTGEAKFLRAFWHLYLTGLYGDIPIVTSTDYTINKSVARSSQASVFDQIKSDLIDAEQLLKDKFVDASDTVVTNERVRPTKWAASALLARVYLYTKDYANAVSKSSTVISSNMFQLLPNLNDVFVKNSLEAIWQLQVPLPTTNNTIDGNSFILKGAPQTTASNNATIASSLKTAFEVNDKRLLNWIHDTTIGGQTYSYPFKYKVYSGSNVTEYTMVLRLAEQYLIRAEARAKQNDLSGALSDLNKIRNRAGLPDTTLSTEPTISNAILHERQVELFTEWGHRWLDLKRTGTVDAVMTVVAPQKGGGWSSYKQWYPVPQSEILLNQSLSQNNGY